MKGSRARLACILLTAALAGCQSAQPRADAPPVKLGFQLDPATVESLSGYRATSEPPNPGASPQIAGRRFHLFDGTNRLFLRVAVSQRAPAAQSPASLLREWLENDPGVSVPFEGIWTDAQLVGEASFVHPLARAGKPSLGLAFVRNNILVQLWESAELRPDPAGGLAGLDAVVDLLPIALEIDAKIQALPDATLEQLKAHQPHIEAFTVASSEVAPNTEVPVTFKATYPGGTSEEPWFSYGIVKTETGLAFKREEEGLHEERAVAIDERLLHSEATIKVRVGRE